MLIFQGHILAHPSHEEHARDMVTAQLHHNPAAYKTLSLNYFEEVTIFNALLIPRWTYGGLFLGNMQHMPQMG